ncbi:MAG: acyl-CoA dehydrogenase family protein [Pseudomonadota bacterium]
MAPIDARSELETHQVENQPPPAGPYDPWEADPVLRFWARVCGADQDALATYGRELGTDALSDAARDANRMPPELVAFDRAGRRIDEVRFHPGYHAQLSAGLSAGYAALPWEAAPGGHATHAAMVYMISGVDPGAACPMTMTYAAVPALTGQGPLAEAWAAKLISRRYDPAVAPLSAKSGATLGMAMTEKQGGSDVRANATRAEHGPDGWRLTGHKWFCSAPMSDGFLTLAQTDAGLTCFLVPRWLEDGTRNRIHLMRLKEKLGNRSNASAEIEYHGALAYPIGAPGDGVRRIIRMVHHTRLDTAMAPAGLMGAALGAALRWAQSRKVFQRCLIDQPLMAQVLADLALEVEGTAALAFRVAEAFDAGADDFARPAVALAKYVANKRAPAMIAEAMECLGGMGYTDDTPMPLFYREAPLNGIWEGSGNVICLDVLRTLGRSEAAQAAIKDAMARVRGSDRRFDGALEAFEARWPGLPEQAEARYHVETLALLLTAATLIEHARPGVADAYVGARLVGARAFSVGATPGLPANVILSPFLDSGAV